MPKLIIKKEFVKAFTDRGVPGSVLFANFSQNYQEVISRLNLEDERGVPVSLSPDKQIKMIELMGTFKKPYLAVMSGKANDAVASQVALMMAVKSVEINAARGFHWHTLTSQPKSKLLDNDNVLQSVLDAGLLIISNIATNSTMMKIEKLRDILELYSAIPRIVVVGGIDPITFCKDTLHKRPNYAIYFGKQGVAKNEEEK